MGTKIMVRKTSNTKEKLYVEVPVFYKSYQTYNRVIDSETIISVYGQEGEGMMIENSITDTEYRKLTPITEQEFNEVYQKHLKIVQKYV